MALKNTKYTVNNPLRSLGKYLNKANIPKGRTNRPRGAARQTCHRFRFALRDRSDRSIRTRDDAQRRRRDDVGVRLDHRHEQHQLNEEKERVERETVLERVRVRQLHD